MSENMVQDAPKIVADPNVMSGKTASLPHTLTKQDIVSRLGFEPNVDDDPDKVEHSWGFTVDGHECAIWDYRGSRWSVYDPDKVLHRVFPEIRPY